MIIQIDSREKLKNEDKRFTVYMHVSPSNKVYIGITGQDDPKSRWNNGKGYARNKHFSNAIEKYGWDNFKHIILADSLSELEAKNMEIELIAAYNSTDGRFGYNITKGGAPCNKGLSDEEKRRRQAEIGKRWKENNRERYLENRRRYDKSAGRKEWVNAYNKTDRRRNHRTEYMREYRDKNRDKIRELNRKAYRKANPDKHRGKDILVYDKEMNLLFEFPSLVEAANSLGYHKGSISAFLTGKKNCRNYIFKYKEGEPIG